MSEELSEVLKRAIRTIPDYPHKGVRFKDLTTLWKDPVVSRRVTDALEEHCRRLGAQKIVGVEARGFIVGSPLADRLGVGFVPARKPKKLPADKVSAKYELEYGKEELEIHLDAIGKGEKVVIVDDLLATGGTAKATQELVGMLGGDVVGLVFVAELGFLGGREKLKGDVFSLVRFGENE